MCLTHCGVNFSYAHVRKLAPFWTFSAWIQGCVQFINHTFNGLKCFFLLKPIYFHLWMRAIDFKAPHTQYTHHSERGKKTKVRPKIIGSYVSVIFICYFSMNYCRNFVNKFICDFVQGSAAAHAHREKQYIWSGHICHTFTVSCFVHTVCVFCGTWK